MTVTFSGTVRRWREDKPGGLAVVDVPDDLVAKLGGRRQMRVTGTLNDVAYNGSTMLVAGGGFCVGVSKAILTSAGVAVGDAVNLAIEPAALQRCPRSAIGSDRSVRAPKTGVRPREHAMKYMLLMSNNPDSEPMENWTAEDIEASGAHMMGIHQELSEAGELLGSAGLADPRTAKIVVSGGDAPVVTDGPFPETKEFLAGYWLIDVDSEERAIEIAARTSAAPGPGGRPTRRPIEVRAVMNGAEREL